MDDAFVVGELERFADLGDDGQGLLGGEAAGMLDLAQVAAIHELHHEVMQVARPPKVMDGDDVGVAQAGQRTGFAVEPLGKPRVTGCGRGQDLQRHQPVQGRLARFIDSAHAALADEAEDFKVGKELGQLGDWRRHKARPRGASRPRLRLGLKAALHQTLRAETQRHIRRQRLAATRANAFGFHN